MSIHIGSTVGSYRVIQRLGSGAMGAVFAAEHEATGLRVALKIIHPELADSEEMVSRFFTEARAATLIGHPNIIDVMDWGQTPDGMNFIAMEYLEGMSLGDRLKLEGLLTIGSAQHIALQLAAGLGASHAVGIIHRDLKPDNVYLVDKDGDAEFVKILDFGLAKLTQGGAGALIHKTRSGSVLGTPHYMAPEQCEGKPIDHRVDIYALGCLLYQMVAGRVPFPGDGFGEVLIKHLREPPQMPGKLNPEVPPGLEKIILHALAKKKEFRFQSMDDFAVALSDPERFVRAIEGEGLTREMFAVLNPPPVERPQPTIDEELSSIRAVGEVELLVLERPVGVEEEFGGWLAADQAPTLSRPLPGLSPRKQGGPWMLLAVAMILLGVIAGAVALGLPPRQAAVLVSSRPPGAELFYQGHSLGTTPLLVRLPLRRSPWVVELRKTGFADVRRRVGRSDRSVEIVLPGLPSSPPPQPSAPPATASPRIGGVVEPGTKAEERLRRREGSSVRRLRQTASAIPSSSSDERTPAVPATKGPSAPARRAGEDVMPPSF